MSMRIRRLVAEVDEQHREAMTNIVDDLAEVHLGTTEDATSASRRRFVRNLGLGGAIALGGAVVPVTALADAAAAQTGTSGAKSNIPDADLKILEFVQGIELALEAAYGLAVDTRYLDSANAEMCRAFSRHHVAHAAALATLAGKANTVTAPNSKLVAALSPQIKAATSQNGVLQVMQSMEQSAAATYLEAIGAIGSWWVAASASSISPIEAQHAAVLGQTIGMPTDQWLPPVQTTASAYDQSQYAS